MSNSLRPHGPSRLFCPWGFSRQEYYITVVLPCPPPRELPNPGIKSRSPTLQADSLPSEPSGKPYHTVILLCQSMFSGPTPFCPRSGSFATAQPWSRDWCPPGFAQGHPGLQLLVLLFSWLFKFIPLNQPSSSQLSHFYNWNIKFKIHTKYTHWPVSIF